MVAVVLVTTVMFYGMVEADRLKIETLTFKTEKLPESVDRLRIVAISDTHFNFFTSTNQAEKIVLAIKRLNPHILVSLGDFLDKKVKDEEAISALFQGLSLPLGKYAITGNHEFFVGIEHALAFLHKAGFTVIRNGAALPGGLLTLAGVDDPEARSRGVDIPVSEEEVLKGLPRDKFTILLKHRPAVDKKCVDLFDLQLSGHTHGGQFFPLHLAVPFFYRHVRGLSKVGDHSYIYVSRGTGFFGPPVRIFSTPEITVVDLVRQSENGAGS
jgi:predicted MPP superfamily phosphohydrolase